MANNITIYRSVNKKMIPVATYSYLNLADAIRLVFRYEKNGYPALALNQNNRILIANNLYKPLAIYGSEIF